MTGLEHSMRCGALTAMAACITVTAGAVTPGAGGFSWSLQDTGLNSSNGSAVAMRNGEVFPVAFNSNGDVASLFSTGWYDIGTIASGFGAFRATSSNDGRVAVAWANNPGDGAVTVLLSGFASLGSGTVAVDFTASGNLVQTSEDAVAGLTDPDNSQFPIFNIVDVAVSPNGDVAVLTDNGILGEYNPLVGAWGSVDLNDSGNGVGSQFFGGSVEYDSLGRPHVVSVGADDRLYAADFNQQTGEFAYSEVSAGLSSSLDISFADIAANDVGVVGTSFISDGDLYYAFNDDNGGWATTLVEANVGFTDQTGITFDYEDLPVVSYDDGGNVWIAYDPIVVPEPTAAALLSLAGLALLRRRAA